jgi:hypothetical protein
VERADKPEALLARRLHGLQQLDPGDGAELTDELLGGAHGPEVAPLDGVGGRGGERGRHEAESEARQGEAGEHQCEAGVR